MLVTNVVGARPNLMKIAPVFLELKQRGIPSTLVHTGQHYDANMSQVFFDELGLPQPDLNLEVGSDTPVNQTAKIMSLLGQVFTDRRPDLVIVGGDVNSTLAASLVAAKMNITIAHVESGLRSFDRTMPEETNRIVVDHLSDFLFTTEQSANENLLNEGIGEDRIHFVGNCMVDTLLKHVEFATAGQPWRDFNLDPNNYALLTLHRPSNVDSRENLESLLDTIGIISAKLPVLFPVHPRTKTRLREWNISLPSSVKLCEPLPYLRFLGLMAKARCVMTDSGGIQEETTALNVPCITLRWNTERPVTIDMGTNRLVGTDPNAIQQSVEDLLSGNWRFGETPHLWDGKSSSRIVDVIQTNLSGKMNG